MHIGHFSSFLIASRLKKYGHNPILLVVGATGQIGDPKPTTERAMITKEEVKKKDTQTELIYKDYEEKLKTVIGTKVNINNKGKGKGKIEIEYFSPDEFDRIIGMMMSMR